MIVEHELKWSDEISFYNIVRHGCWFYFLVVFFLKCWQMRRERLLVEHAHIEVSAYWCLEQPLIPTSIAVSLRTRILIVPCKKQQGLHRKKYDRCITAWLLLPLMMIHLLSIYMWYADEIMPAYHGHTFPKDIQAVMRLVISVARNLSQDPCHTKLVGGDWQ